MTQGGRLVGDPIDPSPGRQLRDCRWPTRLRKWINLWGLATAMVEGLGAQGSFVAMNNVVSQSVAHLHLHVVPRTKGDGLRGFFWPRTKYADGEAAAYAERLRAAV